MTEQEIIMGDKHRGNFSKSSLIAIWKIYEKYNGKQNHGCWCQSSTRKSKSQEFYQWFDNEINKLSGQNNDN